MSQDVNFAFERTEPPFLHTPRFGDQPDTGPDPVVVPVIQADAEDSEEIEEVPDEVVVAGSLSPPRGKPLYTREWCLKLMSLSKENALDIVRAIKAKNEQQLMKTCKISNVSSETAI